MSIRIHIVYTTFLKISISTKNMKLLFNIFRINEFYNLSPFEKNPSDVVQTSPRDARLHPIVNRTRTLHTSDIWQIPTTPSAPAPSLAPQKPSSSPCFLPKSSPPRAHPGTGGVRFCALCVVCMVGVSITDSPPSVRPLSWAHSPFVPLLLLWRPVRAYRCVCWCLRDLAACYLFVLVFVCVSFFPSFVSVSFSRSLADLPTVVVVVVLVVLLLLLTLVMVVVVVVMVVPLLVVVVVVVFVETNGPLVPEMSTNGAKVTPFAW